jgi:RimJ/RimL family protein N-acetyltransferase
MDMQVMDIRPVTLDGTQVRLEPLTKVHHGALAPLIDSTLLQWFTKPVTDAAGLREFIATALEDQAEGRALPFVIVDRATGRPVGSTRYTNIDRANRRLEIGFTWIGRTWQRTPINTEAKLLMMEHAFERLGVIRVEFKTDSLNTQSRAALARLGAVEEGYFRNHMVTASGRIRHSVWFSVIAADWPRLKHQLQERLVRRSWSKQ